MGQKKQRSCACKLEFSKKKIKNYNNGNPTINWRLDICQNKYIEIWYHTSIKTFLHALWGYIYAENKC